MNKVELTGRISTDLELRKTQSNISVISFNLAVDKGFKDEDGNRRVDFIKVNCWNGSADYLNDYACKGALIEVVGRVETNKYTNKNGQNVNETFVTAESVEILSKPKNQNKEVENKAVETIERTQNEFGGSYDQIKSDDLPFY